MSQSGKSIIARGSAILCLLVISLCGCRTSATTQTFDAVSPPRWREAPAERVVALAAETFDTVWSTLYENHFDTNFNGHDWREVREKYRPRALAAKNTQQLRDVIQEMLDLLNVSHLAIVPRELAEEAETSTASKSASLQPADREENGTLGMEVRFLGNDLLVTRLVPNSPAAQAGVKPGWILRRINGVATAEMPGHTPKALDERRRKFLAWRAASNRLSGPAGSEVNLEFLDGGNRPVKLTLSRRAPPGDAVQFGNLPVLYANLDAREIAGLGHARIGLIRFNIWMLPTAIAFNKAIDQFRACDGIIIDLRGNVGGLVGMIIGVAGHFLNEPVSLGAIVTRENTLRLPANPRRVDTQGRTVEPFNRRVAILVDEITASASEVFAGGLQDLGRARVFGRVTSGQALPAILDELPNGDALYHPVADFITDKGTRFEGRGVIPDEQIPLQRKTLLAGEDPTLTSAIRWLSSPQ